MIPCSAQCNAGSVLEAGEKCEETRRSLCVIFLVHISVESEQKFQLDDLCFAINIFSLLTSILNGLECMLDGVFIKSLGEQELILLIYEVNSCACDRERMVNENELRWFHERVFQKEAGRLSSHSTSVRKSFFIDFSIRFVCSVVWIVERHHRNPTQFC